jgi:transposase InsO family protein
MSRANPLWGAPRIVGELHKVGIDLALSTVEKYMVRPLGPSSPSWTTFIRTHAKDMLSIDFFVVPTVKFEILFVFLILAHDRRRVLHLNVTTNPSADWTAQQIVEAFPWNDAPAYLLRDRDSIYGARFQQRVKSIGIEEIVIAPRSPWQNPYVERLIGSIVNAVLTCPQIAGKRCPLFAGHNVPSDGTRIRSGLSDHLLGLGLRLDAA